MSAKTFKPTIIEGLQEIDNLVDVFDYPREVDSGFPYATIVINSSKEEPFLMSGVNKQTHEFSIKIYDEASDRDETEGRLELIKDLVFAKLSEVNLRALGSMREEYTSSDYKFINIESGSAKQLEILFNIEEKVRR